MIVFIYILDENDDDDDNDDIAKKSHFSSVRGLPTYLQYLLYIKSIVAALVF